MNNSKVYLKTELEKIKSLIADDAKNIGIIEDMQSSIKQLKAKNTFRLALLNQLRETIEEKGESK